MRIDPAQYPDRSDIINRFKEANKAFRALPPLEQAIQRTRSRRAYVHAEMALGLDDGKGMSPETIAALPKDDQTVLADEVERLRAENANLQAIYDDLRSWIIRCATDEKPGMTKAEWLNAILYRPDVQDFAEARAAAAAGAIKDAGTRA